MRATPLVSVLFGILAAGHVLRAQAADRAASPLPGDRVRLEVATSALHAAAATSYRWTGRLLGSDTASLLLIGTQRDTVRIGRDHIRRLEVAAGTGRSTGRGALIGGVAGGAVIGVVALASGGCGTKTSGPSPSGWSFGNGGSLCLNPAQLLVGGFVLGALPGALIGALIGSTIPHERWSEAPLPPLPAPPPRATSGPIGSRDQW